MTLVRICNRCGASASEMTADGTVKSLAIAKEAPSTDPVSDDVNVSFSIVSDADLCDICALSAIIRYAVVAYGNDLTTGMVAVYNAQLGFVAHAGPA